MKRHTITLHSSMRVFQTRFAARSRLACGALESKNRTHMNAEANVHSILNTFLETSPLSVRSVFDSSERGLFTAAIIPANARLISEKPIFSWTILRQEAMHTMQLTSHCSYCFKPISPTQAFRCKFFESAEITREDSHACPAAYCSVECAEASANDGHTFWCPAQLRAVAPDAHGIFRSIIRQERVFAENNRPFGPYTLLRALAIVLWRVLSLLRAGVSEKDALLATAAAFLRFPVPYHAPRLRGFDYAQVLGSLDSFFRVAINAIIAGGYTPSGEALTFPEVTVLTFLSTEFLRYLVAVMAQKSIAFFPAGSSVVSLKHGCVEQLECLGLYAILSNCRHSPEPTAALKYSATHKLSLIAASMVSIDEELTVAAPRRE
eukprot:gnl/Chilomastix_cuspidata/1978.p2 GENE.gnl/Chilomastix_cuspidata/1978~~gnl/Chilomastix_cuspidata/1978.p2  ORF type:complete len:378 (+),score=82.63 gnl/Chilomastix_cuspidata/1978:1445-2578(+)